MHQRISLWSRDYKGECLYSAFRYIHSLLIDIIHLKCEHDPLYYTLNPYTFLWTFYIYFNKYILYFTKCYRYILYMLQILCMMCHQHYIWCVTNIIYYILHSTAKPKCCHITHLAFKVDWLLQWRVYMVFYFLSESMFFSIQWSKLK